MGEDLTNQTYEAISPEALGKMRTRAEIALQKYPESALTGGIALRIWCDKLGIPIPAEYGIDTDIEDPNVTKYLNDRSTKAGWIDVFVAKAPMREPFYVFLDYGVNRIRIASLPHLLVQKAVSIKERISEHGNIMAKDLVYWKLLRELTPKKDLKNYIDALQVAQPERVGDADISTQIGALEASIFRLESTGKVSQAVHPDKA